MSKFPRIAKRDETTTCNECGQSVVEPIEEDQQEECPHDERDHGICLDCGDEEDPGAAIDRAMDYFEGD